jgi:hypothetical protein
MLLQQVGVSANAGFPYVGAFGQDFEA